MTRKQKTSAVISILLLLCGAVFVWQYTKNQEERAPQEKNFFEEAFSGESEEAEEGTDEDEGEESLDANDPLNTPDTEAEMKKSSAYVVDQEVCDTECERYRNDAEALAYCQAVCGLAPVEGGAREAPKDCEDRTETNRDICYRDKAVAERNNSLCNKIVDKSLRQSCHNRLAEEYFDE